MGAHPVGALLPGGVGGRLGGVTPTQAEWAAGQDARRAAAVGEMAQYVAEQWHAFAATLPAKFVAQKRLPGQCPPPADSIDESGLRYAWGCWLGDRLALRPYNNGEHDVAGLARLSVSVDIAKLHVTLNAEWLALRLVFFEARPLS